MTTKDCLEMILEPMAESFSVEFARSLVELRATPELQQRIDALAEKANEGQLTDAEEAEYKSFVDTSTILAIMQAKARRFIARRSA
jgi:tRNA threonylcarbamoyladenosine modification (KEOPS) complex Cgi121 subunit